jgi:predicted amidophosphoribosyltransferase
MQKSENEVSRCPDCGRRLDPQIDDPEHDGCGGDRQRFDGTCAMCGEPYDELFGHLKECEARGDDKTTVASTDEKTKWDEDPLGEL